MRLPHLRASRGVRPDPARGARDEATRGSVVMIGRRIAQHMKQQHWTGVFIELVIVILGVFIGLQADNWNNARKQRQAESELIRELRSNLVTAIDIKSNWIKGRTKFMHDLADGIAVVQGLDDSPSLSADECTALWQSGINMFSPSYNPTLIGLLSPSRLGIIHDAKLRASLLSYDSSQERASVYIERVTGTVVMVADQYPGAFPRRLNPHSADLSDATCDLGKIRANQALQNKLLSNLGRVHGILRVANVELSQLNKLKSEVDAYHP